jgi:hypothetical protein
MALANHRVRAFQTLFAMQEFIQTDGNITSVIKIFQDNSGSYILVYDIT